jgi:sporulation protein YlmC with PRC-barrel domain
MKRLMSGLIALAFVASLPAAGFAQGTDRTATDRAKKDRPMWSNTQGLHETGDVIGTRIDGTDGKELGKVDALLIDPKDGKITHAVVGLGGMLGIGTEKVVVPYSALKMTGHEGGRKARITIDRSALERAPKYVKATERSPSASPEASPARSAPAKSDTQKSDTETPAKKY